MSIISSKIKENYIEIQKYKEPYYKAREKQDDLIRSLNAYLEDIEICLDSDSIELIVYFEGMKVISVDPDNLHLITCKDCLDSLVQRYKDLKLILLDQIQIERIEKDFIQLKNNLEKIV